MDSFEELKINEICKEFSHRVNSPSPPSYPLRFYAVISTKTLLQYLGGENKRRQIEGYIIPAHIWFLSPYTSYVS